MHSVCFTLNHPGRWQTLMSSLEKLVAEDLQPGFGLFQHSHLSPQPITQAVVDLTLFRRWHTQGSGDMQIVWTICGLSHSPVVKGLNAHHKCTFPPPRPGNLGDGATHDAAVRLVGPGAPSWQFFVRFFPLVSSPSSLLWSQQSWVLSSRHFSSLVHDWRRG